MKVILAKSAGFCYGVRRAVALTEETAARGGCWMLGDLIHNAHVVEDLRRRGVRKTDRPDEIPAGQTWCCGPTGSCAPCWRRWRAGA